MSGEDSWQLSTVQAPDQVLGEITFVPSSEDSGQGRTTYTVKDAFWMTVLQQFLTAPDGSSDVFTPPATSNGCSISGTP